MFLYGEVFYSFHKGVARVENPAQLHELLSVQLEKPIDWDENYNEDFVCAYHATTYPAALNLTLSNRKAPFMAQQVYDALQDGHNSNETLSTLYRL